MDLKGPQRRLPLFCFRQAWLRLPLVNYALIFSISALHLEHFSITLPQSPVLQSIITAG